MLWKVAQQIQTTVTQTALTLEQERLASHSKDVIKWLSPSDHTTNFNAARSKQHTGTGTWFLQDPLFLEWVAEERKFLWLYGIPGCGKTILSSTVIQYLHEEHASAEAPILSYFFDFADPGKQTTEALLRSLIAQLYVKQEGCRKVVDSLYTACNQGSVSPSTSSLSHTLQLMLRCFSKVYIVLDALDECQTQSGLLKWIRQVYTSAEFRVSLLVTSREEQGLHTGFQSFANHENFVPLESQMVNQDIRNYIQANLYDTTSGFHRWHAQPSVLKEIEQGLVIKAQGM